VGLRSTCLWWWERLCRRRFAARGCARAVLVGGGGLSGVNISQSVLAWWPQAAVSAVVLSPPLSITYVITYTCRDTERYKHTHTHLHTYIHACTYTYIYIYIYTWRRLCRRRFAAGGCARAILVGGGCLSGVSKSSACHRLVASSNGFCCCSLPHSL